MFTALMPLLMSGLLSQGREISSADRLAKIRPGEGHGRAFVYRLLLSAM